MRAIWLSTIVLCFAAFASPSVAQTQCIANVAAQGTSDAITSAQLPCGTTTNLVILTAAAANTTTTPTYAPVGSPPLTITRSAGGALQGGDLQPGYVALLTSTGTSWVLLNPAQVSGFVGLTPSSTSISPKTNGGVLWDNNGVLGDSITLPSGVTVPWTQVGSTPTTLSGYGITDAGTVKSVAETFTGGLVSVAGSPITTSGTLALTVAGTSGGVPYFASNSTWASSGALTANMPVIGGGAGAAPSVGSVSGNTTKFVTTTGALTATHCVDIDGNSNFVDSGAPCPVVNSSTVGYAAYYSGSGVISGETLSALIDASLGSTQGSILYRSSTIWTPLTPGTSGWFLSTQGASANPTWAPAAGGSGCVTGGVSGDILLANGLGGCTTNTNAILSNGVLVLGSSGVPGSVVMGNNASGVITLEPVQSTALGTITEYLPVASGDTLVALAATQTLTNKSIAGSEINSGTVAATYLAAITLSASGNGGVTGVLPMANGGTACASPSITCFNNITGFSANGTTGTTSTALAFSASPTFTGTPAAPTQTTADTSTDIATDAFVHNAINVAVPSLTTSQLYGGTGGAGVAQHFPAGTGVEAALGTNVGSAGSPVINGGALGTPSSGNGANLTSLAAPNMNYTAPQTGGATITQATKNAETIAGQDYGMACNGTTDDQTPFQAAINAAQTAGVELQLIGTCKWTGTVSITAAFHLSGQGPTVTNLNPTTAGTAIAINTNNPVVLENFTITAQTNTQTIVSVTGSTQNNNSIFRAIVFQNYKNGIVFTAAFQWTVDDCLFQTNVVNSVGLDVSNTYNVDFGDSTVVNSWFGTSTTALTGTYGIFWRSSGGLRVENNKFNGPAVSVQVSLASAAVTSDLFFEGDSFEGYNTTAIYMSRAGTTGSLVHVLIEGNEFSSNNANASIINVPPDANGVWLTSLIVTGNSFNGPTSGTNYLINLYSLTGCTVANNNFISGVSTTYKLGTGSSESYCVFGPNIGVGTFQASYIAGSNNTTISPY